MTIPSHLIDAFRTFYTLPDIQVGIDVKRYHMADIKNDELQLPDHGNWRNVDLASRGAHIEVRSGSLEMRDSDIFGTPIIAIGSKVSIHDTVFFGRGNDVTLFECSGTIRNSGFGNPKTPHIDSRTDVYPFLEPYRFDDQYIWSLNIEENTDEGPFIVDHCRFYGSDVALIADSSHVNITACIFEDIKKIAIWNRDSEGLRDWEDNSASNFFGEYDGVHLFTTHTTSIYFEGEDMPSEEERYQWGDGFIDDPASYGIPDVLLLTIVWDRAIIEVPSELRGAKRKENDLSEIPIYLDTSWGGYSLLIVDSSYTGGTVSFTGEYDWWQDVPVPGEGVNAFGVWSDLNEMTGNVAINITFYREELQDLGYNHSLSMDILLNDSPFNSFELWNDSWQGSYWSYLDVDLDLEVGWNNLSISFSGSRTASGNEIIIESYNTSILMVTESTSKEIVQRSIQEKGNLIVFDHNVTMELEGVVPFGHGSSSFWIRHLNLLLHGGSRLSLDGVKEDPSDFLDIWQKGPGHLQLSNFSCGLLSIYSSDSKVDLTNCSVDHHIDTSGWDTGFELTISFCRLEFPPWGNTLSGKDMDITILNTLFISSEPTDYGLSLHGNSTIVIEKCDFHDVTLDITPSLYNECNVQATVSLCRFYGSCSFISMADPYFLTYEDDGPDLWNQTFEVTITKNIFKGPNTGIYGRPRQVMMVGESNQFLDGAKILVWKRAEVQAVGEYNAYAYYNEYYYRYFIDDARDLDKSFLGFYYDDYEDPIALWDVTGNTALAEDPWSLWVMVKYSNDYWGESGHVVWFEKVPALPSMHEIHAPTWGAPDEGIARIIAQGEPEDNPWG